MAGLATHSLFFAFVFMVCLLSEHRILCAKNLQRTTGEGPSYANFVHHPFQYLNATKVKLYLVHEVTDCSTVCVGNFSCFSFNIATKSGMNGYFLCELLASDKYNSSDQFLPHSDFDHYSIHTPCSENPCKNGGACIALYDNDDFKCKCTPGFQGKKCEKARILYVMADPGESCDSQCSKHDMHCVAEGFQGVDVKQKFESLGFPCRTQTPYRYTDNPCYTFRKEHCGGTTKIPDKINCDSGHNDEVRRLCPCLP